MTHYFEVLCIDQPVTSCPSFPQIRGGPAFLPSPRLCPLMVTSFFEAMRDFHFHLILSVCKCWRVGATSDWPPLPGPSRD